MPEIYKQSWRGQASLTTAFWLVYFLSYIALCVLVALLLPIVDSHFTTKDAYLHHANLIKTITFPYIVFSAICVWRCAKNGSSTWDILARIFMVLAVANGLYGILSLIRG